MSKWDLSKFFDRSIDLLVIANSKGEFLELNPMWTQMLGYSESELKARPFFDFIHPEDLPSAIEATKKLSSDGQTLTNFTYRARCKDGSYKHLMWSAWSEDGLIWGSARDITRLKEIEDEAKLQRRIFENTANNVPGVLYRFHLKPNGETGMIYVSNGTREIFNKEIIYAEENKHFDNYFDNTHPDDLDRLKQSILKSASNLSEFHWTGRILTPEEKWIDARSTPVKLDNGTIVWDGIIQDITKMMQAKLELEAARAETVHASKLSALGEMAAGIAHEINNPLAIVHGYADRLLRYATSKKLSTSETIRLAEKILVGTSRIEKTVKSLTKLSYRKAHSVYESKLVTEIISDTLNISNEKFHSSGVGVSITLSAPEIKIECIPIEISQVLLNLLNNSFDAIEVCDEKWIRIEVREQDAKVEIAITDSGSGIPVELQSRLWEPFYTSKEVGKGTGLGLSISRRLVEKHKGRLYIDTKSKNTCFVIELPKISSSRTV